MRRSRRLRLEGVSTHLAEVGLEGGKLADLQLRRCCTEDTARQAFSATGGDPWFLFSSPLAIVFMVCAVAVTVIFSRRQIGEAAGG